MKLTVEQIVAATGGQLVGPIPRSGAGSPFTGVGTDSRAIEPGILFVPIIGERFDGHNFVEVSLERGSAGFVFSPERMSAAEAAKLAGDYNAAAVAVGDTIEALGELAKFVRGSIRGLRVVAVTGSTGKSTVKEMTSAILSGAMRVAKSEGNLNNLVGLPLTLLALPDELDVAVVEMATNAPGEIARLAYIASPDVACVTNVGYAHLEGLGTLEGVAEEKGALPRSLDPNGIFVLNCDDPFVVSVAELTRAELVCYGLEGRPLDECREFVTAREIKTREESSSMVLITGDGEVALDVPAPGIHNVLNALASAAIARAVGSSNGEIARGIGKWRPMKMRTEIRSLKSGITVVVDCYNSNPASLNAALATLDSFRGRRVAVIGDMLELGDYSLQAHVNAGKALAEAGVKVLVAVGDWAEALEESFRRHAPPDAEVICARDALEAAPLLIERLREGDVLLVKASRLLHLESVVEDIEKALEIEEEMH